MSIKVGFFESKDQSLNDEALLLLRKIPNIQIEIIGWNVFLEQRNELPYVYDIERGPKYHGLKNISEFVTKKMLQPI